MGTIKTGYRIQSGVRRSVAAREAGVGKIYAEVFDANGNLLRREALALSELFSPKPQIPRDARFLRAFTGMQSPQTRALIPPIEVIETTRVQWLTPLFQVTLGP